MRAAITFLAASRRRSIALAIAVEVAVLVPLGGWQPMPDGFAAAVATAIAGTVAVVCGPAAGFAVALAGAAAFGFSDDWGTGELAALAVWPGIVLVAGLFARAVQREREALGHLVAAQEDERRRLALELHDGTAQNLAAALIALRHAEQGADPARSAAAAATAHELIQSTIQAVRGLAVELRPKVLDDFGLVPAVEELAASTCRDTDLQIAVSSGDWADRAPGEVELTLYRIVQCALANAAARGAGSLEIGLEQKGGKAAVRLEGDGVASCLDSPDGLDDLRERLRLLNGRLAAGPSGSAGRDVVRAEIPLQAGVKAAPARQPVVTRGTGRAQGGGSRLNVAGIWASALRTIESR